MDASLIILWLTWTALVAALSDFLPAAVALLSSHRCPLTHPGSPLPSTIAGLRAATPRTPGIPLAVGYNRITYQTRTLFKARPMIHCDFGLAHNIRFYTTRLLKIIHNNDIAKCSAMNKFHSICKSQEVTVTVQKQTKRKCKISRIIIVIIVISFAIHSILVTIQK